MNTPLARLLDKQLNGQLRRRVLAARVEGRAWLAIAEDLSAETGERVSGQALRCWCQSQPWSELIDRVRA